MKDIDRTAMLIRQLAQVLISGTLEEAHEAAKEAFRQIDATCPFKADTDTEEVAA